MILTTDDKVKAVFNNYPEHIKPKIDFLRSLILEVAEETDTVEKLEETTKWGEPSYLAKHGSTLRIDWKAKTPNQYAMYFKCTSRLIPTIKTIYSKKFKFENNRAILFSLEDQVPVKELKHCIKLALTYHKVKNMPLLGA